MGWQQRLLWKRRRWRHGARIDAIARPRRLRLAGKTVGQRIHRMGLVGLDLELQFHGQFPADSGNSYLKGDLTLEQNGRALYVDAIAFCELVRDYVSRDLLTDLLDDTEEHIDYLETQLGLIEQMGLQNYLQSAMGEIGGGS